MKETHSVRDYLKRYEFAVKKNTKTRTRKKLSVDRTSDRSKGKPHCHEIHINGEERLAIVLYFLSRQKPRLSRELAGAREEAGPSCVRRSSWSSSNKSRVLYKLVIGTMVRT